MTGLVLPTARLSVEKKIGEIISTDMQSGVVVLVRGDFAVFQVMQAGRKVGELQFPAKQAEQLAGFWKAAADTLVRQGGSGLPASVEAKAQAINKTARRR